MTPQIAAKLNRVRFHPKGAPTERLALINPREANLLRKIGGAGRMTKFGVRSFAPDGGDDGNGGDGYSNSGSANNRSGYSGSGGGTGSQQSSSGGGRPDGGSDNSGGMGGQGSMGSGFGGGPQGGGGQNSGGNRPDGGNDGNGGFGYGVGDSRPNGSGTSSGYASGDGGSLGGVGSRLSSAASAFGSGLMTGLQGWGDALGLTTPAFAKDQARIEQAPDVKDQSRIAPSDIMTAADVPAFGTVAPVKDQSRIADAISQALINNYAAYKNPNATASGITPTRTVGAPDTSASSSYQMAGGAPAANVGEPSGYQLANSVPDNPFGVDTQSGNVVPGTSYASVAALSAPPPQRQEPASQQDPSPEDVTPTPNYNTTYDALASIFGQIPGLTAAKARAAQVASIAPQNSNFSYTRPPSSAQVADSGYPAGYNPNGPETPANGLDAMPGPLAGIPALSNPVTGAPVRIASITPQNYGFSAPPANTQVAAMATPAQDTPAPFTNAQIAAAQPGGAGFAANGQVNTINPNGIAAKVAPSLVSAVNYLTGRPYNPATAGTMDRMVNPLQGQGNPQNRFMGKHGKNTPPPRRHPGPIGEPNPAPGGDTTPPTGTTVQGPMGPAYSYATALGNYVIDIATGKTFKYNAGSQSYAPVAAAA